MAWKNGGADMSRSASNNLIIALDALIKVLSWSIYRRLRPSVVEMRAVTPHPEKSSSQIRRAIYWQGLAVFVMTLLVNSLDAQISGWALLYGGCTTLANTGLLAWRTSATKRRVDETAQQAIRLAYRTGFERLLLVAGLLALGMGVLRLSSLAVLVGFIFGQLAWLVAIAASAGKQIKIR